MTWWLAAKAFIDVANHLFFFDAELACTSILYLPERKRLLRSKICRIGIHSRAQNAKYMEAFGMKPSYIPEWSDGAFWFPLGS
jgi:hypothetical protein